MARKRLPRLFSAWLVDFQIFWLLVIKAALAKCLQPLFKKPDNILLLFMVMTVLSHLTSFVSIFLWQWSRIWEYCHQLKIHFITTFYQFALYKKRSTISDPQFSPPTDFDRKLSSDKMVPIMMEKVARPDLQETLTASTSHRNVSRDALVQLRPYQVLQAVSV